MATDLELLDEYERDKAYRREVLVLNKTQKIMHQFRDWNTSAEAARQLGLNVNYVSATLAYYKKRGIFESAPTSGRKMLWRLTDTGKGKLEGECSPNMQRDNIVAFFKCLPTRPKIRKNGARMARKTVKIRWGL